MKRTMSHLDRKRVPLMQDLGRTRLWLGIAVGILFAAGCELESRNQAASTQQSSAQGKSEIRDTTSEVSLIDAALDGNTKQVRLALENGADVNAAQDEGHTALMMAAFNGHGKIVELLLDRGARVDSKDVLGRTALMYSASGPFPETVGILLEHGADPNISDKSENFTALMFAASEGQVDVVRALLSHRASYETTDDDGETAPGFAQKSGHTEVVQLLENAARAPK